MNLDDYNYTNLTSGKKLQSRNDYKTHQLSSDTEYRAPKIKQRPNTNLSRIDRNILDGYATSPQHEAKPHFQTVSL